MKSFAQRRPEGTSQTDQERRSPTGKSGGQNVQLADALNRSPRVVAQTKLAESLAQRQTRQEVVQRSSDQEEFEIKLAVKEDEEEVKTDLNPPTNLIPERPETELGPTRTPTRRTGVETGPEVEIPEDRRAASAKVQTVYQELQGQLLGGIKDIDLARQRLPETFLTIAADGLVVLSKRLDRLPEVRALLQENERLEGLQQQLGAVLKLLPSLIPAFEPSVKEPTKPRAQSEMEAALRQYDAMRGLKPSLEQRLMAAQEKVKARPTIKEMQRDPKKKESFTRATEEQDKAREALTRLELNQSTLTSKARENEQILAQGGLILAEFGGTVATVDEALRSVQTALDKWPAFLDRLEQQNVALLQQQDNLQRLASLIDGFEELMATYLRFNGSPQAEIYQRYGAYEDDVAALQSDLLNMPMDQILGAIGKITQQVAALEDRPNKLGPLVPSRPELAELKGEISGRMNTQHLTIEEALRATKELGSKDQKSLQSQSGRQKELKKALKGVNTAGPQMETMTALDRVLDEQGNLDEEIETTPDLTHAVTNARLKRLRQKQPGYADLINGLLQSGMVLDPKNLRAELARPVGREKYASREMELGFLLTAASDQGAFVQVGRMRKEQLASALLDHGLTTTAESVAQAAEEEFEADGILYFPDGRIEAVQHKTTTSTDPLKGRTHSTKERTEPELQRQLKDAANQLSGLTAQGNTANISGGIPETPPPGARRIANLRFEKAYLPGNDELSDYDAIVKSVLGGEQRQSKGPRWKFVEVVILNFRNGRVVYTAQGEGRYGGRVEPSKQSKLKPYTFELDTRS